MDFGFRKAEEDEIEEALNMLKDAARNLQSKKINQWEYWLNPSSEKINWIKEGFRNGEFNFIIYLDQIIGMFRLLNEDYLYWGKELKKAKYIHSLVIKKQFSGNKIGEKVIGKLSKIALKKNVYILRLDCNSANKNLCRYYEKQGFVKVREKQMPHSLNNLYEKRLN